MKTLDIVTVAWPMINDPTSFKYRRAVIAHIGDDNIMLLFSMSSYPSQPQAIEIEQSSWLLPDRFLLVHGSACKPVNKAITQAQLDQCITTSKWKFQEMTSVESSYFDELEYTTSAPTQLKKPSNIRRSKKCQAKNDF